MIVLIAYGLQDYDPFAEHKPKKVRDRDNDYKKQQRPAMMISPARHDPFADGMYAICMLFRCQGSNHPVCPHEPTILLFNIILDTICYVKHDL